MLPKHVFIIGIGGIGTSSLAQLYLSRGVKVSGSDVAHSDITDYLQQKGANVFIGHDAGHLALDEDLVIFSPAVKADNPELVEAQNQGITAQPWQQALGDLIRDNFVIAITGTHGKSTTTAMAALMMVDAGLDPTVIIGTKLREFGDTNFRMGNSKYVVLEADDFNRNFMFYHPNIEVITNIDTDHLDYYGSLEGVKEGFRDFIGNLKTGGALVVNEGDPAAVEVAKSITLAKDQKLVFYGQGGHHYRTRVFGEHNHSNAAAAAAVGKLLGIEEAKIAQSLGQFKGTWRRQELVAPGIYSDYGHHPTEIRATLQALKEAFPDKKLLCVFEPHQADRTKQLLADFQEAFDYADTVILLPIYLVKGRDEQVKVSSKDIAIGSDHPNMRFEADFQSAFNEARKWVNAGGLVVFMGAGTIDENLRQALKDKI